MTCPAILPSYRERHPQNEKCSDILQEKAISIQPLTILADRKFEASRRNFSFTAEGAENAEEERKRREINGTRFFFIFAPWRLRSCVLELMFVGTESINHVPFCVRAEC
jgi:hypothetical protein